jgi:hypothetical protein
MKSYTPRIVALSISIPPCKYSLVSYELHLKNICREL